MVKDLGGSKECKVAIMITYKLKTCPPLCYLFVVLPGLDTTACPKSSGPFYIGSYYIQWGHYFLDLQYLCTN